MSAREILEILYAPYKAFKAIIQNPRYIGPILVMVLFILANIGFGYAFLSTTYFDQTKPQSSDLDKWTEGTSYWTSNASIAPNNQDYISGASGAYYGNNSIQFSINDSSDVWMLLNTSSSVSCSGPEGYKLLSFRLKLKSIEPPANPSNVSLYTISSTLQDTFYQDITNQVNQTGVWLNLTIAVGDESAGWLKNANADWSDITGLKLDLTWPTESNITLLVDGLFFHGLYKSGIELSSMTVVDLGFRYSPLNTFMQFTIQWVIFGGILFLIPKAFGLKTVWKPMLAIAGFVLITICIQTVINSVVFATMWNLHYPLEYLGQVPGEQQNVYNSLLQEISTPYLTLFIVDKIIWVWIIALCAIALRSMFSLSWGKSFLASVSSYLIYVVLFSFLPLPSTIIL